MVKVKRHHRSNVIEKVVVSKKTQRLLERLIDYPSGTFFDHLLEYDKKEDKYLLEDYLNSFGVEKFFEECKEFENTADRDYEEARYEGDASPAEYERQLDAYYKFIESLKHDIKKR